MLVGPGHPTAGADFRSGAGTSSPLWKVSAFRDAEQYWVLEGLFPSSFMILVIDKIHTFSYCIQVLFLCVSPTTGSPHLPRPAFTPLPPPFSISMSLLLEPAGGWGGMNWTRTTVSKVWGGPAWMHTCTGIQRPCPGTSWDHGQTQPATATSLSADLLFLPRMSGFEPGRADPSPLWGRWPHMASSCALSEEFRHHPRCFPSCPAPLQALNKPPVMICLHKMKKSVSEFFPNCKQGCLSYK